MLEFTRALREGKEGMRCLIVEDEKQVRESLAELVPWGRLGFSAPITAENGLEALDCLRSERLDLVISDVRMPRMSGTELLKTMREEGMETPFLFISGFSDKDYLMTAIRYHAVDYLEKPVMIPELVERIHALFERMNAPRGWVAAHELFEPGAQLPPLFQGARRFYVGVLLVSADGMRLTSQQLDRIVRSFHREALLEMETPERSVLVAAQGEQEICFQTLVDALNAAGGGYALCLSDGVEELSRLPEAYSQATECATLAWMRPLRGVHRHSELLLQAPEQEEAAGELRELCARQMWPLVGEAAEGLTEALRREKRLVRRGALGALQAMLEAAGAPSSEGLADCGCFEEAAGRALQSIFTSVNEQMSRRFSPSVHRAIDYIAQNLDGALSIAEIAQAAFVSPSHLSFRFRQETGESIRQYVIAMRIERAKRLLHVGEQSVSEVASAVGIADEVYFSRLFKKLTGATPNKFVRGETEEEHAGEASAN